jgi:hypothetical protein
MSWWQSVRRSLGYMDFSVTVVVFTVPTKRLREMDVALGPCVPTGGRKRPLVGVTRQEGGEYPHHTAALYTVLTGEPADDALRLLEEKGRGRLFQCSAPFVEAMADASLTVSRLAAEHEARGDGDWPSVVEQHEAWSREWMRICRWPRGVETTTHRLWRMQWAARARERGHPLYLWHGPAVDMYTAESVVLRDDRE